MKPRYYFTRLYVALSILVNVVITATEPQALGYKVLTETGPLGWLCVGILGCLALIAVMDVLINDLAPEAWHLPTAIRWRPITYMLLATGIASYVFVIIDAVGFTWLTLTYFLDASVAVVVGVLDLFYRRGAK